ncbi:MAG: tRNA (uridine(34)/cytosine(34)/5-carboxymethylaminomethyluridine(34)-2'-O)-methyltransferase TrmL [Clostridia bacterium]|jgi:tRNA (cytidine/uridine-2'-O-)-methyltransferase|nr:tRNA (uridine(34)/cytosine(34)/5-carboxymethylaminomethyluridine(34)-2'-O)-methyltransferase TrmL [Clostridia bacterium]
MGMNIVLVEPEIPQNTGNIVRTCGGVGATLHLVRPLGFSVEDKYLKRAGLDYWHLVDIRYYDSVDEVLKYQQENFPEAVNYFCSTKAKKAHSEVEFKDGDFLFFGKETKGLPEDLIFANYETAIRIPMRDDFRSLNLSNAVAIIVYEAMRQQGYPEMF